MKFIKVLSRALFDISKSLRKVVTKVWFLNKNLNVDVDGCLRNLVQNDLSGCYKGVFSIRPDPFEPFEPFSKLKTTLCKYWTLIKIN